MVGGWLWVFSLAVVASAIIAAANMWQAVNADKLVMFGVKFKNP